MPIKKLIYKLRTHSDPYQTMIDAADKLKELADENERLEAHAQKLIEALDGLINQYALRTFTGVIVSSSEQYPWIAKAMRARSLTPTSALASALAEMKRENEVLKKALKKDPHSVWWRDYYEWLKARNAGGKDG